jgi:hypothetical protein
MKEFFQSKLSIDLPLRFWKSHLLDLPRVTKHGIFYLDPGEATLMHHRDYSIVGSNADQIRVAEPKFEPVKEIAESVRQALQRLIEDVDLSKAVARACIKVDMDPGPSDVCEGGYARPQLNAAYGEPLTGHIWMLPGKMTEAPFVADMVTKEVCERLGNSVGSLGISALVRPVTIARALWRSITRSRSTAFVRPVAVALRPIDTY